MISNLIQRKKSSESYQAVYLVMHLLLQVFQLDILSTIWLFFFAGVENQAKLNNKTIDLNLSLLQIGKARYLVVFVLSLFYKVFRVITRNLIQRGIMLCRVFDLVMVNGKFKFCKAFFVSKEDYCEAFIKVGVFPHICINIYPFMVNII